MPHRRGIFTKDRRLRVLSKKEYTKLRENWIKNYGFDIGDYEKYLGKIKKEKG